MTAPVSEGRGWTPGSAPVAVVMITLNEGPRLGGALENLAGWAQNVFIVDSFSSDNTVDIALEAGVTVVQREFRGFGDQWNFALGAQPAGAPWTMKLDPDERLDDELKRSIEQAVERDGAAGLSFDRRLWFMGRPLHVRSPIVRVWRTGSCQFSSVRVNEHPIVDGPVTHISGVLEHHDSPNLQHWLDKQNRYSTSEALAALRDEELSVEPRLFGTPLERRMWIKKRFRLLPGRFFALFAYHLFKLGAWRDGFAGLRWATLRCFVYWFGELKVREMEQVGAYSLPRSDSPAGVPDDRVPSFD